MKGIVFREFIDFVEDQMGDAVVDQMITKADPPSGAAYTAVGQYDWHEMADLVSALSQITKVPTPDLLQSFGGHLFGRFSSLFPQFFDSQAGTFDFLLGVENYIHVEVLKLYPDAELPTIDAELQNEKTMSLKYKSCRPFGELCIGMIKGCATHFGEDLNVTSQSCDDGLNILIEDLVA